MIIDKTLLEIQSLNEEYKNNIIKLLPKIKEELLTLAIETFKDDYLSAIDLIEISSPDGRNIECIYFSNLETSIPYIERNQLIAIARLQNYRQSGKDYYSINLEEVPFKFNEYLSKLKENPILISLLLPQPNYISLYLK